MTNPRLVVHLDRLHHNVTLLAERLHHRGISVTGITKATMGSPEVARCLLGGGVAGLGEARIENVERLRRAGITAPITMIRSPMVSQAARVVASADTSLNTEPVVLAALSAEAVRQGRTHRVVLMVELGDLREGVLPQDLPDLLATAHDLDNLEVVGIGANLACQHGIGPDDANMAVLSELADRHDAGSGRRLDLVSGGNSASYDWALATVDVGRVNNLRLGEAILLGRQPLNRRPIDGLRTDAVELIAEVIERKRKPAAPWGTRAQAAFDSPRPPSASAEVDREQALVALGHQDTDPGGLTPPAGLTILGASSDHLVLAADADRVTAGVGDEVGFELSYGALLRAMTSPFIQRVFVDPPADTLSI